MVDEKGFSFSSKKEGTLVPAYGERGFFVPSILRHDDRYDNFNGLMLARLIYTDSMDKEYCTCQCYNNGIENGTYINTEAEKMESPEGLEVYRVRAKTVERVFGHIKQNIGLRAF